MREGKGEKREKSMGKYVTMGETRRDRENMLEENERREKTGGKHKTTFAKKV